MTINQDKKAKAIRVIFRSFSRAMKLNIFAVASTLLTLLIFWLSAIKNEWFEKLWELFVELGLSWLSNWKK